MPVHVTRKRAGYWYAAGTVKAGGQSVTVAEYSTGCRARVDADAVAAKRDREERAQLIEGGAPPLMIAECFTSYATRPGGLKRYDVTRLLDLNRFAGNFPLGQAATAWSAWVANRGTGQKPTSIARWRNTFQAAINHGAAAHGVTAPRLPSVKGGSGVERAIYLTDDERKRLLAAYNAHAASPVLLLAYQGMRTQEALQLDWRRVKFDLGTIDLPADETKSQKPRTVPMHPRVDALLFGMWHAVGKPTDGPVFLSSRGEPYSDTRGRDGGRQGGNPLASAHRTACRAAKIKGFRVHDHRHDWAHRMVMSGCDLRTLMDLGGWSSLRMVQRYAAGAPRQAVEAIGRLR